MITEKQRQKASKDMYLDKTEMQIQIYHKTEDWQLESWFCFGDVFYPSKIWKTPYFSAYTARY